MAKRISRAAIKKSLIEQLESKGAELPCFIDLVNQYMEFWDTLQAMTKDIKQRGAQYQDSSSTGVKMWKQNPNVKERTAISRQMLAILKELDITTDYASEMNELEDEPL